MDANHVLETFLPYPLHGKIPLGNRKSKRVDLGTRDSSDDGDHQGTLARANLQDTVTRFNLCLGDYMLNFAHLSYM